VPSPGEASKDLGDFGLVDRVGHSEQVIGDRGTHPRSAAARDRSAEAAPDETFARGLDAHLDRRDADRRERGQKARKSVAQSSRPDRGLDREGQQPVLAGRSQAMGTLTHRQQGTHLPEEPVLSTLSIDLLRDGPQGPQQLQYVGSTCSHGKLTSDDGSRNVTPALDRERLVGAGADPLGPIPSARHEVVDPAQASDMAAVEHNPSVCTIYPALRRPDQ
jgi:hypothetical protein